METKFTFFTFQIDSIKWYKDGREFFRLHPNMPINNDNHRKQFQTAGVKIDYNTTSVWKLLAHEILFEKKHFSSLVSNPAAERATHRFTGDQNLPVI